MNDINMEYMIFMEIYMFRNDYKYMCIIMGCLKCVFFLYNKKVIFS